LPDIYASITEILLLIYKLLSFHPVKNVSKMASKIPVNTALLISNQQNESPINEVQHIIFSSYLSAWPFTDTTCCWLVHVSFFSTPIPVIFTWL